MAAPEISIAASAAGPVRVLAVTGRLDHAQTAAFETALAPHLAVCTPGGTPLLFDFSGLEYISSVGLRALMLVARTVSGQGGKAALAGLQPMVQEVFRISRFHHVMPMHDSVAAGVAALSAA